MLELNWDDVDRRANAGSCGEYGVVISRTASSTQHAQDFALSASPTYVNGYVLTDGHGQCWTAPNNTAGTILQVRAKNEKHVCHLHLDGVITIAPTVFVMPNTKS